MHQRLTGKQHCLATFGAVRIIGQILAKAGGSQIPMLRRILVGGGIEIWVKPALAIYVDGARVRLKGGAVGGAEGAMDDNLTYVMFGARVHLGR